MNWLNLSDYQGNMFYFDVHHVEKRRAGRNWVQRTHGVCGNGQYESLAVVEFGNGNDVTFVPMPGEGDNTARLLASVSRHELEQALLEAVTERFRDVRMLPAAKVRHKEPRHPLLAENPPIWNQVV